MYDEIEIAFKNRETGELYTVKGNLGEIAWDLDGWIDTKHEGDNYAIIRVRAIKNVHGSD